MKEQFVKRMPPMDSPKKKYLQPKFDEEYKCPDHGNKQDPRDCWKAPGHFEEKKGVEAADRTFLQIKEREGMKTLLKNRDKDDALKVA